MSDNYSSNSGGYFLASGTPSSIIGVNEMSTKKHYRVKRDNFLWQVGAILENCANNGSYMPLDKTDIWNVTEYNGGECISSRIIENNPEYFERVYAVNLLTKTVYKLKAEAAELMAKSYE